MKKGDLVYVEKIHPQSYYRQHADTWLGVWECIEETGVSTHLQPVEGYTCLRLHRRGFPPVHGMAVQVRPPTEAEEAAWRLGG